MAEGQIPFLTVRAKTLPLAWEKAVLLCWAKGAPVCTEYDRAGDPPSRDCTMAITVTAPLAEPRIHRAFPGSLEDLEIYRREVVKGIHDHCLGQFTLIKGLVPGFGAITGFVIGNAAIGEQRCQIQGLLLVGLPFQDFE